MATAHFTKETMDAWRDVVDRFPPSCKDVYYGPDYYRTWMDHESADPMCLHIISDGIDFLYPFFRAPIERRQTLSAVYDIFSAYGYGGMIASIPAHQIPATCLAKVNDEVDAWCARNGVIAEFVRQNPLFSNQCGPLRRAYNVTVRRNVYRRYDTAVAITSASARRNVKKAVRCGLRARVDTAMETLEDFDRLYADTATRVGMPPYYHFGDTYSSAVSRCLNGDAMLLNIEHEDMVVASSMVFQTGPFTTYHLSGSDARYQKYYPNDLLLATLVEMADSGADAVLSFGGGLGNADDDALFAFKNRFGNMVLPVTVGKNIHDERAYAELCETWALNYPHLRERYENHVLKYRMTQ